MYVRGGLCVVSIIHRLGFLSALACALAACAIHPVPENVTGVKTSEIVHRNRCEARDALLQVERFLLSRRRLAAAATLRKIGIIYSYELDIYETDSLTAMSTFTQPLTKGSRTFNPSAGDSLKRENIRTFTITDNYQTLSRLTDKQCASAATGPNYQYPIVGTIGIDEMIRTFLTMALHEDLGENETNTKNVQEVDSSTSAGPPTMVDSITFTTTISAGVTPAITLTPVGALTQLTSASLGVSLTRQDLHEAIIALGLPALPPINPGQSSPKITSATPPKTTSTTTTTAQSRIRTPLLVVAAIQDPNSGEQAALEALNNHIIRFQVLQSALIAAP